MIKDTYHPIKVPDQIPEQGPDQVPIHIHIFFYLPTRCATGTALLRPTMLPTVSFLTHRGKMGYVIRG